MQAWKMLTTKLMRNLTMISISDAKKQATVLKKFLAQNNSTITHSSCLQAISIINGFKDWNTMSAMVNPHDINQPDDLQGSEHIKIFQSALNHMTKLERDGKLDEDGYRLLWFVLNKLSVNSANVLFFYRNISELGKEWSRHRFTIAINQLVFAKFIDVNADFDGFLITVNPSYFWKGDDQTNIKAIDNFNDEETLRNEGQDNPDFSSSRIELVGETNPEISEQVEFIAEMRNNNSHYPKKAPNIIFFDQAQSYKHPDITKLQLLLRNEKDVADPRVYFTKIKAALEGKYYVGYGGAHIHIKSLDERDEIANITGGIL